MAYLLSKHSWYSPHTELRNLLSGTQGGAAMRALKCLSFQTVNTDYLQVPDYWSILRLGPEKSQ